jgi:hypothetical protein
MGEELVNEAEISAMLRAFAGAGAPSPSDARTRRPYRVLITASRHCRIVRCSRRARRGIQTVGRPKQKGPSLSPFPIFAPMSSEQHFASSVVKACASTSMGRSHSARSGTRKSSPRTLGRARALRQVRW